MVYNTVLAMVQDVQEAEDVCQEVFIQAFQGIRQFRGDCRLQSWLYRIAVTRSIDQQRKAKTRNRIASWKNRIGLGNPEDVPEVTAFHHPGIQLENKERAALLFRAIQQLPANQRTAFTLIRVEGLSYQEVGEVMQLSVKAIESLIQRGQERLRKILHEYYSDNS